MTTISIPLTTLPVGSRDFGPASIADANSVATITIDRTVTNGFNSQPGATQLVMTISQSADGGATWIQLTSATITGGLVVAPKYGGTVTTSVVGISLPPGTNRQVMGNLNVSGSSVAVQGSLIIQ